MGNGTCEYTNENTHTDIGFTKITLKQLDHFDHSL